MSTVSSAIVKTVQLTPDEDSIIRQISAATHLPESALMKKFVLEGVARYRLDETIAAYQRGEMDLSRAARYAQVSIYQMLDEMRRRGIAINTSEEKFLSGLESFANDFGGTDELKRALSSMHNRSEL